MIFAPFNYRVLRAFRPWQTLEFSEFAGDLPERKAPPRGRPEAEQNRQNLETNGKLYKSLSETRKRQDFEL